jgi:U3 small nucleolar RNA-associated protein 13
MESLDRCQILWQNGVVILQVLLEISGLEDLLAAIGPYSQRHIAHLDRLLCSSFVIDYSLSRLSYISQSSDM